MLATWRCPRHSFCPRSAPSAPVLWLLGGFACSTRTHQPNSSGREARVQGTRARSDSVTGRHEAGSQVPSANTGSFAVCLCEPVSPVDWPDCLRGLGTSDSTSVVSSASDEQQPLVETSPQVKADPRDLGTALPGSYTLLHLPLAPGMSPLTCLYSSGLVCPGCLLRDVCREEGVGGCWA